MSAVKYLFVLFLIISPTFSLFNFRKGLNDAIKKAKDLYKNRFSKDKSWHFLGYDPTEYPGTNKEYRKINAEKWDNYYNCLLKQNESLENHGSIIPEAVLAFEGEYITFECKVCLSPLEQNDIEAVEWEWSSETNGYLEPLDYSEHTLVSPEDKTLHLYNLGVQQTGQYVCRLKNQLTAPYFLTVVNSSEPFQEVHRKSVENATYPEPAWLIHPEIILDTMWGKWTPCSKCNKVGKRHKIGYCIIILLKNFEQPNTENINNIFEENSIEEQESNDDSEINYIKTKKDIYISETDMQILQIFKYGVPCRSHILPTTIVNIEEIQIRKSEIMTGFCKVKCPADKLFVVKDDDGNVIETANNSAGIYSMMQGIPLVEPQVERRLQFEAADKKISLTCPGNLNSDMPIKWQIGTKNVVPELLSKESKGRLSISILDKITIRKSRVSDSNIYSCWQNKELAGTIRLVVEKQLKFDLNHHMMLIGIVLILSTFLYVFAKAFIGKKYAKV